MGWKEVISNNILSALVIRIRWAKIDYEEDQPFYNEKEQKFTVISRIPLSLSLPTSWKQCNDETTDDAAIRKGKYSTLEGRVFEDKPTGK